MKTLKTKFVATILVVGLICLLVGFGCGQTPEKPIKNCFAYMVFISDSTLNSIKAFREKRKECENYFDIAININGEIFVFNYGWEDKNLIQGHYNKLESIEQPNSR